MKRQYQKNLKLIVNLLVFVTLILLCILLLPKLLVFFMPFVIGWIISCMANPLVHFLEHRIKIRRKAGTVMVIVLVIAAVVGACYLVISILAKQIVGFVGEIPEMWESLQQDFSQFRRKYPGFLRSGSQRYGRKYCQCGNRSRDVSFICLFLYCRQRIYAGACG